MTQREDFKAVILRLHPESKEAVQDAAKRAGLSVNQWLTRLIERELLPHKEAA
jgi:predicted HicB family RNase H-like nuclease